MACNIETIEKVDCRLVLTDASGNIAKEFDLANTDMSFNSYEFTIKDFKNEFIIPIADLSSINSGAYATFTDLYNFIAGERTDCICACGGGGGSGTVTSVELTMPSGFGVSGSPITSAGTLAVSMSGTTNQYLSGDGTLKNLYLIRDIVGGTAVTGTTANTKCYSKLINGNTFLVSDIPRLFVQGEKVGTNSTSVMRLYFNTIDSLSGASFVGSISVSATQLSIGFERDFAVMSSTTIMILDTISANTTSTNTTQAPLTFTIDISLGQYLIVAFQNASASDSSNVKFVKLQ